MSKEKYKEKKQKPNIILILMDACRRDHLGCYGYDKPTSPNIDLLAKESVVFENAFSISNSTTPCLTSIFSGYSILTHQIIRHLNINEKDFAELNRRKIKFLPEILRKEGYCTMAFDWLGRWHKRGYDFYEGLGEHNFKIKLSGIKLPYDRADKIVKKARQKIKSSKKPFFAFLHFWDTHSPYAPPFTYSMKFRKYNYTSLGMKDIPVTLATEWMHILTKDVNEIFRRYDGSIRFVDHHLGKLVHFLKKEKLYENTIIVLMADHGEDLIDHHNYFDHHSLYDNVLRIPFIIKAPGISSKKVSSLFQEIDIVPTLLNQVGPDSKTDGCAFDLNDDSKNINKRNELFFISNYGKIVAFRNKNYKYIHEVKAGLEEAYDIIKDPEERINLITDEKLLRFLREKTEPAIMKIKKIRENVGDSKELVYDKLYYASMQKRIEFLEKDVERRKKELESTKEKLYARLEKAQGSVYVKTRRKLKDTARKIRARLRI